MAQRAVRRMARQRPSDNWRFAMRAELRSYFSPDVDLEVYSGGLLNADSLLLTLLVGPLDGPGEESFDVQVCTPQWIKERLAQKGTPEIGRHLLIVNSIQVVEID